MSMTPDYGEPWSLRTEGSRTVIITPGATGADFDLPIHAARAVACVNACQGMTDPAAEIQAMREAINNASHFASCILTEAGRQWQATQPLPDIASIEAVAQQIQDELQPFIKP